MESGTRTKLPVVDIGIIVTIYFQIYSIFLPLHLFCAVTIVVINNTGLKKESSRVCEVFREKNSGFPTPESTGNVIEVQYVLV